MALPPGPTQAAFFQTRRWVRRPTELLLESREKFGDTFTIRFLGIGPMVMFSSPAAVREIFAADPDLLRAGESNVVLRPLLGDHSVLILDGPAHRRQRRLLMPPFHGERMRAYTETMRLAAERSIESWPTGRPFALHDRMQQVTLDVILKAVFGIDGASPDGKRFGELLSSLLDAIASPLLLLPSLLGIDGFRVAPFTAMSRRKRAADAAIRAEIARRRASPARADDVLSMLLDARDEEGKGMTDEELRDELMTLLVAGHETSATALAWTFDLLLHESAVLERVVAEAKSAADPAKSAYLDATVKESLRLRPVLPLVQRRVQAPYTIAGVELPAGVRAVPCIWLLHRRPDLYPEPERFRPERFLERQYDAAEWIPFGGANRRCLGATFAMHEMKVVLASVASHVKLEPVDALQPIARRSITFSPKSGTRVIARAA